MSAASTLKMMTSRPNDTGYTKHNINSNALNYNDDYFSNINLDFYHNDDDDNSDKSNIIKK